MVPNGVGTGRPPAKSFSPRRVWQSAQLPVAASARPRLTSAGSNDCGAGGSMAAIAGRQTIANAATAPAIEMPAMANPMFRDNAMRFAGYRSTEGPYHNIVTPNQDRARGPAAL